MIDPKNSKPLSDSLPNLTDAPKIRERSGEESVCKYTMDDMVNVTGNFWDIKATAEIMSQRFDVKE